MPVLTEKQYQVGVSSPKKDLFWGGNKKVATQYMQTQQATCILWPACQDRGLLI